MGKGDTKPSRGSGKDSKVEFSSRKDAVFARESELNVCLLECTVTPALCQAVSSNAHTLAPGRKWTFRHTELFAHQSETFLPRLHGNVGPSQRAMCIKSPPGAEAEGFSVGVDDEEPTLALRHRVKSSQDPTSVPPLPEGILRVHVQSSGEHEACFGSIRRAAASCR